MSRFQTLLEPKTILMVVVAFVGSLFYGASLSRGLGSDALGSALWLTICAGLGWAALIPTLTWATRRSLVEVLQACLVSICFGEAVLALGAVGNLSGFLHGTTQNLGVVLVSNVVMAAALASQLSSIGFAVWKALALWLLVLDGVGALAFWSLSFLLGGVR